MHRLAAIGVLSLIMPLRAHAAAAPSALNVRLSDLPSGYFTVADQLLTPAQLAAREHRPISTYAGLRLSSQRLFAGDPQSTVIAAVAVFTSARSAHRLYSLTTASAIKSEGPRDRRLAAPGIGDENVSIVGFANGTKPPVPASILIFRRGDYLVDIYITTDSKAFTPAAILRLGALVDRRAQHGT